ncbi:MAG: 4-alpha-glucanotransferase [Chitinophagaceae bacterium]|jgi:4-alpha-glucanotransferase|nr:4-alpha-glucanotransferase [Chitinophagaceae bacterium]
MIEPVKATMNEKTSSTNILDILSITFEIEYRTQPGQNLYITGEHAKFGNGVLADALPMHYSGDYRWTATVTFSPEEIPTEKCRYHYLLQNADGSYEHDWGGYDKALDFSLFTSGNIFISDSWNYSGFTENVFYSKAFKFLLNKNYTHIEINEPENYAHRLDEYAHTFSIKAPLLNKGEVVCLLGNNEALHNWNTNAPVFMQFDQSAGVWKTKINLTNVLQPVEYKYGVYNISDKKFVCYENGENRALPHFPNTVQQYFINDGFIALPNNTWRGNGIVTPLFSLKSEKSFGVGDFADLKLLVDWATQTGSQLIQLLPINDTTANHSWTDSYPYSAISVFAIHPMYMDVSALANDSILEKYEQERSRLNALQTVDYEAANRLKWKIINEVYLKDKETFFQNDEYNYFFSHNENWLLPYAAFCFLRDKYHTPDFSQWHSHSVYEENAIDALYKENKEAIELYCYVQYHLHKQLTQTVNYAHANNVVLKGDVAIGVYRFGADSWQHPHLFNMSLQAGAPPDAFSTEGQNWGFPTYNWKAMKEENYSWWKQRLKHQSQYFDAVRIDHILGFFRIWSTPYSAVQGVLGYFDPTIHVHKNVLELRGITVNENRLCAPFITVQLLNDIFSDKKDFVKNTFLDAVNENEFKFKPAFATQRKILQYFNDKEDNAQNRWLKNSLFVLIANVVLIKPVTGEEDVYHFRINMQDTPSYQWLDNNSKRELWSLYENYFHNRHNAFWRLEGLEKLPAIKMASDMLICGEDLGWVPDCVPEVMQRLNILSLEVQRMSKQASQEFSDPLQAPYLSVVTPSTHDTSTIRGWWQEDAEKIQRFYNYQLHLQGAAPAECNASINKMIVRQHLNSPAIWCIILLQDILGISERLNWANAADEQINHPGNPQQYWRYRMHHTLEELLDDENFNNEWKNMIKIAGR